MKNINTKICTKCGEAKLLSEFSKDKQKKDGLSAPCKDCIKKYYYATQEKQLIYSRKYYRKNKAHCAEQNKKWMITHANERKIYKKKYNTENKEKNKITSKIWRNNNKNKIKRKKYMKVWLKNNKNKTRLSNQIYIKNRTQTDVIFKMNRTTQRSVRARLKNYPIFLPPKFLIGCDVEYLMYYLQTKFKVGMSWDNYGFGGWVIDHIKPVASFDLYKDSEQRKCFHYTNLQPLWEKENSDKQILDMKVIKNAKSKIS